MNQTAKSRRQGRLIHLVAALPMFLAMPFAGLAQTCSGLFPTEEGTMLIYRNIREDGKETEDTVWVRNVVEAEGKITWEMQGLTHLPNNTPQMVSKKCECADSIYHIREYEIEVAGGVTKDAVYKYQALEYPHKPWAGQLLKGGGHSYELYRQGRLITSQKTTVSERRVGGYEKVETPAGEFECYYLTERVVFTSDGRKSSQSLTLWISPGVGTVRVAKGEGHSAKVTSELVKVIRP